MSLKIDIEKQLGNFFLKVDTEIDDEVISFLGESGCGKSMTLKCIAGIEKPDKGRIILNDRVLFDSEKHINLKPQQRRVGYLFQQYALFPNMNVRQNIMCGIHKDATKTNADGSQTKLSRNEKADIVSRMIASMGLAGMDKKLPSQLSGGQQQRVALARILVNEPDVLLLDEPFSALDAHLRVMMEKEVSDIVKNYGKPVIFVSHDRDEVYRVSDKVAIFDNGHITKFDDKDTVFLEPETVRGAILTGIDNIYEAETVSENSVFVKDLGITLTTKNVDIDGLTHVGIPKHHIIYGSDLENVPEQHRGNEFICDITDVIDNPMYAMVLIKPTDVEATATIAIDIPKNEWRRMDHNKIKIQIMPQGIRALRN